MDIERLKSSIFKVLCFWGIVFWIITLVNLAYINIDVGMFLIVSAVLIIPIIVLYFLGKKQVK